MDRHAVQQFLFDARLIGGQATGEEVERVVNLVQSRGRAVDEDRLADYVRQYELFTISMRAVLDGQDVSGLWQSAAKDSYTAMKRCATKLGLAVPDELGKMPATNGRQPRRDYLYTWEAYARKVLHEKGN